MASFRKRNDKWEYRIKYKDPATGKTKEKSKGGFRTKKEAQIVAGGIEKKLYIGNDTIVRNQDVLIKDWMEEWLDVYVSLCHPSTLSVRKSYVYSHIIPHLGHYKLNELTKLEYQKIISRISEKYAKKTVQTVHTIFRIAINKAVELEMLTHNKFTRVSINTVEDVSKTKINYLTREEVGVFMEAARQSPFHHYIMSSLLLRTGMRKGEMLALTWADIDFEENTLKISKSRGAFGVNPPKTKASNRTIVIDDVLISDLKQYKAWQEKNKVKFGSNYIDSDFMLILPHGKETSERNVTNSIQSIIKKTNLHHISPHGLRHTHAVMLLESGADIKLVSDRLGHASIDVTANVYLHITKNHETDSVLKLQSYLNN